MFVNLSSLFKKRAGIAFSVSSQSLLRCLSGTACELLREKLGIVLIFIGGFFLLALGTHINFAVAQTTSPDAIAIRVIPNPNHYSARHWYNQQGFAGSPQSLTVDGYGAVRDGRTVYVNAANINLGNLWTNIYIISYNQKAESATVDIFSQILAHWQFNTNISSFGYCRQDSAIACLEDIECPADDFCDSLKAEVARDTKRLADLAEIQLALNNYIANKGYYPRLAAGTYLPYKTISVWPSWQDTLAGELGVSLSVDPINELGACPGYDQITCWNETTKTFAAILPDLPSNSLVYTYDGNTGNVCVILESGLIISGAPVCALGICLDFDGDGYGRPASINCPYPELDCDDTNPSITVGVAEDAGGANCDDGIDNDCDGFRDCDDSDCPPCGASGACDFDGSCESGESCLTCEDDCGACPVTCPDGFCDISCECLGDGDDSDYCPEDCYCGNGSIDCGEECDDGCLAGVPNVCEPIDDGDGCSSVCIIEASGCVDTDSDGYDTCGLGEFGDDGKIIDCDDNIMACGANCFSGNSEICDGYDNDCDGTDDNGTGMTEETCDWICINNGFVWSGNGGILNCCGNDLAEAPYQLAEDSPTNYCNDNSDNDCDGTCDLANDACFVGSLADSDCTGICNNLGEQDWINAATPGDCNQCDFDDNDNDGDQTLNGEDWTPFPDMVDQCDNNCGVVLATVQLIDYENSNETSCDNIDNDCDGTVDENLTQACYTGFPGTENVGVCIGGTEICSAGVWGSCAGEITPSPDICDNGVDDDCDNSTDCADADCAADLACIGGVCVFPFLFPCSL